MAGPRPECPVLIAGAGPVGLIAALELAHHGVRCLLIDRAPEPTRFPKMDITNGRSMELLRRLGLTDRVRAIGVLGTHPFDVLWALPDGEAPFGRWDLPSVDAQRAAILARNDGSMPLEPDQRVTQSAFEAMGRALCRAEPLIDFREGVAFEAMVQDADGVDVTVSDVPGGARTTYRAAFLVGADGAGSRVRQQLDIGMDNGSPLPRTFMVHFRSRNLEVIHRHGRFWHYYVNGAVLIAQDEIDTWTFHAPLFGGPAPGEEPDPATIIAERIGLALRIDEVLLTSLWQPRFALADRYAAGRVFLAGDAVHQVFPTGGYGMNTGVGDAVDLGWKLAAVINGWAGPRLLDSYEAERRPVAAINRDTSRRHLGIIVATAEMAGAGASRDELKAFVEANRGENEFDGIEFGYRYTTSPVIAHEAGDAPPWRAEAYVPSTWPGARPPSFTLTDGSALFDHFGREFTLVDFRGDAEALVAAAVQRDVPMTHLPLDEPAMRGAWERDYVLIRPDQHVAWRGDRQPDQADWAAVIDLVTGR